MALDLQQRAAQHWHRWHDTRHKTESSCKNSTPGLAKNGGDYPSFFNSQVIQDLDALKAKADFIIANCAATKLADVASKVFARDLFGAE